MTTFASNAVLERFCEQLRDGEPDWSTLGKRIKKEWVEDHYGLSKCMKVYVRDIVADICKYLSVPGLRECVLHDRKSGIFTGMNDPSDRYIVSRKVNESKSVTIGEITAAVYAQGVTAIVESRVVKIEGHIAKEAHEVRDVECGFLQNILEHAERVKQPFSEIFGARAVGYVILVPHAFPGESEKIKMRAEEFAKQGIHLVPFYTTLAEFQTEAVRRQKSI